VPELVKALAFRQRRNVVLLAIVVGLVLFAHAVLLVSLAPRARYSGWVLAGLVIVLTCYNFFKQLPFLPLGRSATWLQFHIYAGLLSIVVFMLHSGGRLPHGPIGWFVGTLYIGVAASGVLGLIMSRVFPILLRARGPEIIYEQIPEAQRQVRLQAETLVIEAVSKYHASLIADFYMNRLRWFFAKPRQFWRHLLRLPGRKHRMRVELDAQERYLDEAEKDLLHRLRGLIDQKDSLDFQYALQGMLKYWLFVHIPLTYSLLVFAVLHVLLVYAYA
jgi:hypothetical protein